MISEQELDLTKFDQNNFVEQFGGMYEHSPWVAVGVWSEINRHQKISYESLLEKLRAVVEAAPNDQKLALLRAHPELAGKAATEGTLTAESTDEQARARLDLCSKDEFDMFHQLNSAYNEKFEFPFIMAVRNSTREEILQAFASRLHNQKPAEFATAMQQVHLIAALRLEAYAAAANDKG